MRFSRLRDRDLQRLSSNSRHLYASVSLSTSPALMYYRRRQFKVTEVISDVVIVVILFHCVVYRPCFEELSFCYTVSRLVLSLCVTSCLYGVQYLQHIVCCTIHFVGYFSCLLNNRLLCLEIHGSAVCMYRLDCIKCVCENDLLVVNLDSIGGILGTNKQLAC